METVLKNVDPITDAIKNTDSRDSAILMIHMSARSSQSPMKTTCADAGGKIG